MQGKLGKYGFGLLHNFSWVANVHFMTIRTTCFDTGFPSQVKFTNSLLRPFFGFRATMTYFASASVKVGQEQDDGLHVCFPISPNFLIRYCVCVWGGGGEGDRRYVRRWLKLSWGKQTYLKISMNQYINKKAFQ